MSPKVLFETLLGFITWKHAQLVSFSDNGYFNSGARPASAISKAASGRQIPSSAESLKKNKKRHGDSPRAREGGRKFDYAKTL